MLTLSKFGINERHASLSPCWWFCRSASSPPKSKSTWDAICCWQHGHLYRSRVKFSTIVHGLASINIWLQPRQQLWNSPCIWDALNFSACLKFSSWRITNNSLYWEGRIAMGNGPNGVRTDWLIWASTLRPAKRNERLNLEYFVSEHNMSWSGGMLFSPDLWRVLNGLWNRLGPAGW